MTMLQKTRSILRRKRFLLLLAGVIVLSGVSLSFGLLKHGKTSSDYFTESIQRGPLRTAVDATGTLQTLVTVQVGSQVSGQIEALYADYNSIVKRGQLLARIDPRNFEAQVEDSKANLSAAEAHVQSLEAAQTTQQANLESAKANLEAARIDRDNTAVVYQRNLELNEKGLVAQNDLDTARQEIKTARALMPVDPAGVPDIASSQFLRIGIAQYLLPQLYAPVIGPEFADLLARIEGRVSPNPFF